MICAEFEQASKKRKAGNFWKTFDVWCIGTVEKFVQEESQDSNASDVDGYRHGDNKPRGYEERLTTKRGLKSGFTGSIRTYTCIPDNLVIHTCRAKQTQTVDGA
jgi:hypothetical protein